MTIDLGRLLVAAGVVSPAEVEAALFLAVLRGISFPRALVDRGAISERALDDELDRMGGLALRQVMGSRELFARLPRAMCRRLAAVPTRHDPVTGTVDVAAADPLDPHIPAEFGFHLGMPVRVLRAPIAAVEEAIRGLELDEKEPGMARARPRRVTPAFPHGAPQSTIPPPPVEEVPIPLVRRAPVPVIDEEALPLRHTKPERPASEVSARGRPASPPGEAETPAPRAVRGARPTGGGGRAPVLREPAVEPPAVSFPSSPPAPEEAANAEPRATLAGPVPAERAALRAPALPEIRPRSDQVPATQRHGRLVMGRPPISIEIPPPRTEEAEAQPAPGEGEGAAPAEVEAGAGDGINDAGSGHTPGQPPRSGTKPPGPPTFADLTEVYGALDVVRTRDEIVRVTLQGLRLLARRVAVFAIKRGAFQGYACNEEFGDERALRRLAIPVDQPSILATATATSVYLGPVPGTPTHAPLLDVLENPSLDVTAVAVRVAGRPVMVLVADDLGETLRGTRSMDELARAAGNALTRVLAARL